MSVVGRGHIVVWEGASLWMLKGAQETAELHPHSHHAVQITFQLEGSFELMVMDECLTGPIAAVWSDTLHSFRASGAVAFLFIAPESTVGRALGAKLFAGRPSINVATEPLISALAELRAVFRTIKTAEQIHRAGLKILNTLPAAEATTLPDRRTLSMIAYARANLENTVTLSAAAAHICLSRSRARHLFAAQTGLPFKSYILWLRLERAVALYARGSSLTEAAHSAGFSDSAHFSRTFKRTFGLPAATLRLLHD